MRKLVAGVDAQGRSCLVDETSVELQRLDAIPTLAMARLYATDQSPPPPRPPAQSERVDVGLAPGFVRWNVVAHDPYDEPTVTTTMHHADKLDLVFVADGSADFVLQDGAHHVGVGDCVVTAGVDHAWKAGPDGVCLVVVSIGTPPP
jgi:hypothetical protein